MTILLDGTNWPAHSGELATIKTAVTAPISSPEASTEAPGGRAAPSPASR